MPLQDEVVKPIRKTLFLLWGGALFVLLIGVINIANLAVARGSVRMRELATRAALGAGRWRIARQLLTESVLMTAGGTALGLLLGYWGLGLLRLLHVEQIPRGAEVGLSGTVVLYVLGLSLAAAVVIGVIPVVQALRVNLVSVLRDDVRTGTGGRGGRVLRHGLVVAQVAFALVLLMGAGLLTASFRQVLAIRPGFVPEQVVTGTVGLPASPIPGRRGDARVHGAVAGEDPRDPRRPRGRRHQLDPVRQRLQRQRHHGRGLHDEARRVAHFRRQHVGHAPATSRR